MSDFFDSLFDFDGDGKVTPEDDLFLLWLMEDDLSDRDDCDDRDNWFAPTRSKTSFAKRTQNDLNAKLDLAARCSFDALVKAAQTVLEQGGVSEKTGRQVAAELSEAFLFLSLAGANASCDEKAAMFNLMTAFCREEGAAPTGCGHSWNSPAAEGQAYAQRIHDDLKLLLSGKAVGTDAIADLIFCFSNFLHAVENRNQQDHRDFHFTKEPDRLFYECVLRSLKEARPTDAAVDASSLKAHVFQRTLCQRKKRLKTTAVISSVLFSVLSVLPCCMIGYFFTLLPEYDDLTDLFLHSLVFIVVPLVFLVLFAVGCFDGVRDEYRRYTTFKQTFMEESIEANK